MGRERVVAKRVLREAKAGSPETPFREPSSPGCSASPRYGSRDTNLNSLIGKGFPGNKTAVDCDMYFEIVGKIEDIETIAVGGRVRDIMRLRRQFGEGRWRKLKGVARVRIANGETRKAEVHWCEAHGIGRKKIKIKRFLS